MSNVLIYDAFGTRVLAGLKKMYGSLEQKDSDGMLQLSGLEFVSTWTTDRVQKILGTAKGIISHTIGKGVDEGLSTNEIAKNIREATGGAIASSRARTIARTETHTAAQAGSKGGALATGRKIVQIWISAEDGDVRPTHQAAERESKANPVPLEEFFRVGNSHLMYPGDPSGEPEEIINCRCVIVFEPVDL